MDRDARPASRLVPLAGTVVLILFVAFKAIGPSAPVVASPPGFQDPVLAMELAATADDVFGIVGPPGHPARAAAVASMRRVTRLDFLFLLAYPALYVGIARALGARRAAPAWVPAAIALLAVAMLAGDAIENVQILKLIDAVDPAAMAPVLARLRLATLVKWNALFVASGLLAPWMWRSGIGGRWSGAAFGLAALCGLLWPAHLPAIEWSLAPMGVAWTIAWVWFLRARRTTAA